MDRKERAGWAVFIAMSFVIPWTVSLVVRSESLDNWMILTCSAGAFLAMWVEGGRAGLATFARRTLHIRGSVPYILAGLAIPVALGLLYMHLKGVPMAALHPAWKAGFGTTLVAGFFTGPLAEEFAWRGYLQQKLLARMRPVLALLVIVPVWCLWHLPFFYDSVFAHAKPAIGFCTYLAAWSVMQMYLVVRSRGSVWPSVFLHWSANMHAFVLQRLFPGVDGSLLPGGGGSVMLYAMAALAFLVFGARFYFGSRRDTDEVALPAQATA